jgi:hypothetical protein
MSEETNPIEKHPDFLGLEEPTQFRGLSFRADFTNFDLPKLGWEGPTPPPAPEPVMPPVTPVLKKSKKSKKDLF